MICSNCGQAATAADHFCARCGAPFFGVTGPAATMPYYGQSSHVSLTGADQDSRYWAVAAHLSALIGAFAVVLGAVVGPFAIWMARKAVDPFAAENARQALNFNLSVLPYFFVLAVLTVTTLGFGLVITLPAMLGLGVAWLLLSLAAALRAWNDGIFRYPFAIQFIK
ncbi:MAG: DUF4870 domain-containing protein [Chloroflexota bacterium]|nr:DUF4870 domain-containing protein [Chloroflexota bacterium]